MRTAESYFIQEFKEYMKYKEILLTSNNSYIDPRIGGIMRRCPTQEQITAYQSLKNLQFKILRGADLGCNMSLHGESAVMDFLNHIIPKSYKRITSEFVTYCTVLHCDEPYFKDLVGKTGKVGERLSYHKRLTGNDGQFLVDNNGNVMTQDIDIPQDSRVVRSTVNIHLPKRVKFNENSDRLVPYNPTEGFGYLDYEDTPDGREYLYYIPRKYIYPLNLNTMVLSIKRYRNSSYYFGREYAFNRGATTVYLYTMPYCKNILKPYNIVFGMRTNSDFDNDIAQLETMWTRGTKKGGSILYPVVAFQSLEAAGVHTEANQGTLVCSNMTTSIIEPKPAYDKNLAQLALEE